MDVGAGVSPLAPFLSSRGYLVETVDPSPIVRNWPEQLEWNEWGYLDYAAAGLASRSWNCTLDRIPTQPAFDGAYSVSVIEHVPAAERRRLLADMSARTRTGGVVVLTIDLQPGSDDLWNYNMGVQVDDPSKHGTLQSVVSECAAVGLDLLYEERVRDWPETHVEIGLLALRQQTTGEPTASRLEPPQQILVKALVAGVLTCGRDDRNRWLQPGSCEMSSSTPSKTSVPEIE